MLKIAIHCIGALSFCFFIVNNIADWQFAIGNLQSKMLVVFIFVFSIKTCTNEARHEKAHLKCVTDQGPLKQASVATET